LHAAGFDRPDRVYAVYYDGGTTAACGGGAWPPALQGNVAALISGRPTAPASRATTRRSRAAGCRSWTSRCSTRSCTRWASYRRVPRTTHARDTSPTTRATSCTPATSPARPSVLDVGQDDYYHAHILECRELAVSPYLERNVEHPKVALSVAVTGPGKVASARAGVRCKPRCRVTVEKGSTVALRATPAMGARLVRWGGACKGSQRCRVVMGGARKVTALFRR
jgi:List-Bact-rpt repeat protein